MVTRTAWSVRKRRPLLAAMLIIGGLGIGGAAYALWPAGSESASGALPDPALPSGERPRAGPPDGPGSISGSESGSLPDPAAPSANRLRAGPPKGAGSGSEAGSEATPSPEPSATAAAEDRRQRPGPRGPSRTSHRDKAPRSQKAYITVSSVPWGAVYVDGRRVSNDTPLYRHPVAPGRHEVKVFFPDRGQYSAVRHIDLEPGEIETLGLRP